MTKEQQLLVLLLAVGVSAHSDKCNHEQNMYNVGDIVRFIPNDCLMLVCRPNNVIEEVKPLGQHSRKCCVCHNKLYGRTSQTCKTLQETGTCPGPCKEAGKEWAHGDIVETNLAKCTRRRCLNGEIILEQSLGNGLTGCCLENKLIGNNEKMVAPGTVVSNGGCVPETCINSNWVPNATSIIESCAKCRAFNDPHFNDFSGATFDWHIGCNHALVQERSSMNPEFGVFMDFDRRGRIGYIGGPTTYQEDKHIQVVLHPGNTILTVNGHQQQITSSIPTVLVGPGFAKTTVMAWKHRNCIRLYGKPKILVQLCGNSITLWAAQWSLGQKPLAGLCGSTNKNALQERKLVDRQGNKHPNPGGFNVAPAAFGYGWQALDQTKVGCPEGDGAGRDKPGKILGAKEAQAEKDRKVCEHVRKSHHTTQCIEVIKAAGLSEADHHMLLGACVFDLCIVSTDQEAGITVEDMLQQHQEIATEHKDVEDNTIEFVPAETICHAEWSPVGGQCYKVYPFTEGLSIEDAQRHCISHQATLARPRDVNATNNFLKSALLSLPRGDEPTGVAKEWLIDGGVICNKPEGYICEREPLACGDEDDDCAWRAADGECEGNKPYMYNFCKTSCNVSCDCDQPDTCTEVGGMCQPLGTKCGPPPLGPQTQSQVISDPTLCPAENCTCCYVPDPCQDAEDQDCKSFVEEGYCEAKEKYILEEMMKYCSYSCGFCEPMY